MPEPIITDQPLNPLQRTTLRALVALVIPASDQYHIPSAADAPIFADILKTLVPQAHLAREVIQQIEDLSGQSSFAELHLEDQVKIVERFRASRSPLVSFIQSLVAQCYYRDDRVMRSLGMEPRPPFPKGYEIDQGDWTLLDPVRQRAKIYRDAP